MKKIPKVIQTSEPVTTVNLPPSAGPQNHVSKNFSARPLDKSLGLMTTSLDHLDDDDSEDAKVCYDKTNSDEAGGNEDRYWSALGMARKKSLSQMGSQNLTWMGGQKERQRHSARERYDRR